ncbi:MAG: GNAT family N-acetyltransferase [Candidatus Latescibacteria bacterium]|nr:GNAT family N-acetyltransferase [Candidatus Latescibacterota bacterium]
MTYRHATLNDITVLAAMNRQLAGDEQHRNRNKPTEWFNKRMELFLNGEYEAIIFEQDKKVLGYALYRNHPEQSDTIYLRQIFINRNYRRQGFGHKAIKIMMNEVWPKDKRLTVEVLSGNDAAISFYKSVGFQDYCLELELKAEDRR